MYELNFAVKRLGNNFTAARQAIIESCKYYLDLPNELASKEILQESIGNADLALEKCQDCFLKLLEEMENGRSQKCPGSRLERMR